LSIRRFYPSFTRCDIRTSAYPQIRLLPVWPVNSTRHGLMGPSERKPTTLGFRSVGLNMHCLLIAQCYGQFGELKHWWPKFRQVLAWPRRLVFSHGWRQALKNLNITIAHCQKKFADCVMVKLEFFNCDLCSVISPTTMSPLHRI